LFNLPVPHTQRVHSFDLVASDPGVVACNMAEVPLGDAFADVAVFSLALMGTDYGSFLEEAHRVREWMSLGAKCNLGVHT